MSGLIVPSTEFSLAPFDEQFSDVVLSFLGTVAKVETASTYGQVNVQLKVPESHKFNAFALSEFKLQQLQFVVMQYTEEEAPPRRAVKRR